MFSRRRKGFEYKWEQTQTFFQPRPCSQGEVASSGNLSVRQAEGFLQVGSGSLPSSNQWLFVPPLAFLEGQTCGALGSGSLEVGVYDSLSQFSSPVRDSHTHGFVLSPIHQGEGLGGGDSGSLPQGSGGACVIFSGLLQPDVCRHQGIGRMETDHQPLHSEPVSGSDVFSGGDCSDGPSFGAEERLDGLRRSERRVPSDPDPPCELQVSQVHSRRQDLAVSGSVFQSVHGATGVYSHDGTCVGLPPSAWCPDASVSGRLADSGFFLGGGLVGKGSGSRLVPGTGIVINLEKSTLLPSQEIVYLGIKIDLQTFRALATPLRIEKFFSIVEFLSSKVQSVKSWRVLLGHHTSRTPRSEWSAAHESLATGFKARLGFSGRGDPGSLGRPFSRRSSLVVHRGSSRRGGFSVPALSRTNVLVRCL